MYEKNMVICEFRKHIINPRTDQFLVYCYIFSLYILRTLFFVYDYFQYCTLILCTCETVDTAALCNCPLLRGMLTLCTGINDTCLHDKQKLAPICARPEEDPLTAS